MATRSEFLSSLPSHLRGAVETGLAESGGHDLLRRVVDPYLVFGEWPTGDTARLAALEFVRESKSRVVDQSSYNHLDEFLQQEQVESDASGPLGPVIAGVATSATVGLGAVGLRVYADKKVRAQWSTFASEEGDLVEQGKALLADVIRNTTNATAWDAVGRMATAVGFDPSTWEDLVGERFGLGIFQEFVGVLAKAAWSGEQQALANFPEGMTIEDMAIEVGPWARLRAHRLAQGQQAMAANLARESIHRWIDQGVSQGTIYQRLKRLMGLTNQQAITVDVMRRSLRDQGHGEKAVTQILNSYLDRKHAERQELIARTEIGYALNYGNQLAIEKAVASGLLPADTRKVWVTGADERVCPHCRPMDAEETALHSAFTTSLGNVLVPPIHPRCRCIIVPVSASFKRERGGEKRQVSKHGGPGKHESGSAQLVHGLGQAIKNPTSEEAWEAMDWKAKGILASAGMVSGAAVAIAVTRSTRVTRVIMGGPWRTPRTGRDLFRVSEDDLVKKGFAEHIDSMTAPRSDKHGVYTEDFLSTLQGRNWDETTEIIERSIKSSNVEHSFKVDADGTILHGMRGASYEVPSLNPRALSEEARGQITSIHNHPGRDFPLSTPDVEGFVANPWGRERAVTTAGSVSEFKLLRRPTAQEADVARAHLGMMDDWMEADVLRFMKENPEEVSNFVASRSGRSGEEMARGIQEMWNDRNAARYAERLNEAHEQIAKGRGGDPWVEYGWIEGLRKLFAKHLMDTKDDHDQSSHGHGVRNAAMGVAGAAAGIVTGMAALAVAVRLKRINMNRVATGVPAGEDMAAHFAKMRELMMNGQPHPGVPANIPRATTFDDTAIPPGTYGVFDDDFLRTLQGSSKEETLNIIERSIKGLDYEHSFFVDEAGSVLAGFRGSKTDTLMAVPAEIQNRKLRSLSITHNHPGANVPISTADTQMWTISGVGEVRAVTPDGSVSRLTLQGGSPMSRTRGYTLGKTSQELNDINQQVSTRYVEWVAAQVGEDAQSLAGSFKFNPQRQQQLMNDYPLDRFARENETWYRAFMDDRYERMNDMFPWFNHEWLTELRKHLEGTPFDHDQSEHGQKAVTTGDAKVGATSLLAAAGISAAAFAAWKLKLRRVDWVAPSVGPYDNVADAFQKTREILHYRPDYRSLDSFDAKVKEGGFATRGQHGVVNGNFSDDVLRSVTGSSRDETIDLIERTIKGFEYEHSFVVDDSGKVLSGVRGGTGSVDAVIPDELTASERMGLTYIHNHPGADIPLSPPDVENWVRYGAGESRVVTPNGSVSRMRRTSDGPTWTDEPGSFNGLGDRVGLDVDRAVNKAAMHTYKQYQRWLDELSGEDILALKRSHGVEDYSRWADQYAMDDWINSPENAARYTEAVNEGYVELADQYDWLDYEWIERLRKHLGGSSGTEPHPSGTPQTVHAGGRVADLAHAAGVLNQVEGLSEPLSGIPHSRYLRADLASFKLAETVSDQIASLTGDAFATKLRTGINAWTNHKGVAEARDVERGMDWPSKKRREVARQAGFKTLVDTASSAPANAPTLYRGLRLTDSEIKRIKKGGTFRTPLSSWTEEERVAAFFGDTSRKPVWERGGQRRVLIELEQGSKALNIAPMADQQAWRAKEWVSSGQFEIVGMSTRKSRPIRRASRLDREYLVVKVRQTDSVSKADLAEERFAALLSTPLEIHSSDDWDEFAEEFGKRTVTVQAHTRSDGTNVKEHERTLGERAEDWLEPAGDFARDWAPETLAGAMVAGVALIATRGSAIRFMPRGLADDLLTKSPSLVARRLNAGEDITEIGLNPQGVASETIESIVTFASGGTRVIRHGAMEANPPNFVREFINTLSRAPKNSPELWRGLRASNEDFARFTTPGSEIALGPSSFSSARYAGWTFSRKKSGDHLVTDANEVAKHHSVIFHLPERSRGLRIEQVSAFEREREWIVGGRFRVANARRNMTVSNISVKPDAPDWARSSRVETTWEVDLEEVAPIAPFDDSLIEQVLQRSGTVSTGAGVTAGGVTAAATREKE